MPEEGTIESHIETLKACLDVMGETFESIVGTAKDQGNILVLAAASALVDSGQALAAALLGLTLANGAGAGA